MLLFTYLASNIVIFSEDDSRRRFDERMDQSDEKINQIKSSSDGVSPTPSAISRKKRKKAKRERAENSEIVTNVDLPDQQKELEIQDISSPENQR